MMCSNAPPCALHILILMCLSRKQTAQRALLGKYYVTYCNLADVMIQRSSFSSAEKANVSVG